MLKCFCRIFSAQQPLHHLLNRNARIANKALAKHVANHNLYGVSLSNSLHTTPVLPDKLFRDAENMYAFDVLQTIPVVNSTTAYTPKSLNKTVTATEDFNRLLDRDFRSATVADIVQTFKDALHYCVSNNINISDHRFDKLVDGLVDHIEHLTDDDLYELLNILSEYPLCPNYSSHNFHDVWSALDDVCLARISEWSTDDMFRFAELWYKLQLGEFC